ncbi:MAG: hypothetical protein LWX08_08500 [Deltaproteobacteria bacterium]|jgi:hypothetical protein|nr:hypothetical protein [Deltaproteobacteria bacterium]
MQEKDRVMRKIVFCGEIAGFACCKVMPGCCIVIFCESLRYGDAVV